MYSHGTTVTNEQMTIRDSIIESITYQFKPGGDVMVKLRLKRCGRKQRVACQRGSFVDSYIHHLNYKCALGSTSFVLLHPNLGFFWIGV